MAEEFRVLRPYEYHSQLIKKGRRADGRKLEEARDVKLEIDAIRTADSSSLVKLGNTSLVCGCTTQLINSRDGNEGDEIKIKVELPPICSSPTGYTTQNTAHLLTKSLKNILDDTDCLDRQCLYLKEKGQFWCIDVEVICLNYDGCLLDAALIAVLSALKSLKLSDNSRKDIPTSNFQTKSIPICTSYAIIGDRIICDPNLEEESIAQSTFSITIDKTKNEECHVDKTGGRAISASELLQCIELARVRSANLENVLNNVNGDKNMDYT